MSTWGVSMMKNEEDVAYGVVMHLVSEGLQGFVIYDNGSEDGTRAELERAAEDAAGRATVVVLDDPEVGYYQSRKITELASFAADRGADWIVPFDADEIWYAPDGRLADFLLGMSKRTYIVHAEMLNHWGCSSDDPADPDPFHRMQHRHAAVNELPKVAVRWHKSLVIEQGNHSATVTARNALAGSGLRIRHFPYRSPEQFIRKARQGAAAYAATDLPHHIGQHWREYGAMTDEALREVYFTWYHFDAMTPGFVFDPAPYRRHA